jgi:hypothetical protein
MFDFARHYYSWVLAMLLNQHNLQTHTYPRAIFNVNNFTMTGYSCMPDKVRTFPFRSCHSFTLLQHGWSLGLS